MKITYFHRAIIIASIIVQTGCSTIPVAEQPVERINRIVESVRKATSFGFLDVTIDYTNQNIYISGHTYHSAHIARLMRSVVDDGFQNLKLIEIKNQNVKGESTFAFQLIEPDVGSISKWTGPILLKYSLPENSAERSADMLHLYSLNDFKFLTVVSPGQQKKAVIRCPDGLYQIREGSYLGKERALVSEINEESVILIEQSGAKRELKRLQRN